MRRNISALTFVVLIHVSLASAEEASVEGTVRFAGGSPAVGADVVVSGTSSKATSDVGGQYAIAGLLAGAEISVVASTSLADHQMKTLVLAAGRNTLDFELKPKFTSEVSVTAEIPSLNAGQGVSQVSLSPEQVAVLPSLGEQDIFRALQLLPGVSSNETSSGLYVRGGTPDQNLTSFDGFTVFHVDHLFGYFSAFNMDAVERVELRKGSFEAPYGGRLSSVMEVTGKSGDTRDAEFGGGLSFLSGHLVAQVPFAGKGSLLLAGRHSFQSPLYDKILDLSSSNQSGSAGARGGGRFGAMFDTQPTSSFYDMNGKLLFEPSSKDRTTVSLYRGNDDLDNSRNLKLPEDLKQRLRDRGREVPDDIDISDVSDLVNSGASGQWSRRWSDRFETRLTIGWSEYVSDRDRSSAAGTNRSGLVENNSLEDTTARFDVPISLGAHQLQMGAQVTSNNVRYQYDTGEATGVAPSGSPLALSSVLNRDDDGQQLAVYAQDRATLGGRLVLTGGLRYTRYDQTEQGYVEPRISASLQLGGSTRLKAAAGRYHQFANRIVREDVLQGNRGFWSLADGNTIPVPSADHFAAGLSYETKGFLVDAEFFGKRVSDLTQFAPRLSTTTQDIDYDQFYYHGRGESYGLELLAQKKLGRNTGWISYTVSRSEQTFPDLAAVPFVSDYDRTHELKLVDTFRRGRWTLSGTWILGTGTPYTEPIGTETVDLVFGDITRGVERVVAGDKNGVRLPTYHRLDLALNREVDLGPVKGLLGVTVFNVYDRQNVWYKEFTVVDSEIAENNIRLMGRTVNAFLNVRF
jgi:hypothetical protein